MSFAEQERALFDLLFDAPLREKFSKNPRVALQNYALNADELDDFDTINPHALALDARVRVDLILAQWCRSLPLTFSLMSSLVGGLDVVKSLVDSQTMNQAPNDRIVVFATRLRQALIAKPLVDLDELSLIVAVLDAELGMASTSRLLKRSIVTEQFIEQAPTHVDEHCLSQPICLAPYVSAAIIPLSYSLLKKNLCPYLGSELWRYLNKTPLLAVERQRLFKQADTRLLVSRATVSQLSACEPSVDHITAELTEVILNFCNHRSASLFDGVAYT